MVEKQRKLRPKATLSILQLCDMKLKFRSILYHQRKNNRIGSLSCKRVPLWQIREEKAREENWKPSSVLEKVFRIKIKIAVGRLHRESIEDP